MVFALEYDDMRIAFRISSSFAGLAIVLSSSVLATSLWIYLTPSARSHVERLSWRLFMVILGLQIVWATMYIITYADPILASRVASTDPGCSTAMFLMVGCRLTISWLITSIAVNLALTLRWNVNCTKRGLARWYIIGSAILGFTPPLVAAARGHFRGGTRYGTCYFAAVRPYRKYLIRVFLAFHLWLALATVVALTAVVISMTSIFTQARRTSRLIHQAARMSQAVLQRPAAVRGVPFETDKDAEVDDRSFGSDTSTSSTHSRMCFGSRSAKPTPSDRMVTERSDARRMSMYSLDDAFLRIAIRVMIYPVLAVILNAIYISTDVFFYLYPKELPESYEVLYTLGLVLYAGRGSIFAAVAIMIDPCLHQGVKAAWRARKEVQTPHPGFHSDNLISPKSLSLPLHGAPARDPTSATCSFWDMIQANPKVPLPMSPPISPLMVLVAPQIANQGLTRADAADSEVEVDLRLSRGYFERSGGTMPGIGQGLTGGREGAELSGGDIPSGGGREGQRLGRVIGEEDVESAGRGGLGGLGIRSVGAGCRSTRHTSVNDL